MSIASKLEKLATDIGNAYTAIGTKGGTIPSNKNTDNLVNAINSISGAGASTSKDVNLYDYDGTLLHSYTKTEFLALTSLPANPTHEGLIAQGWNWTLADAKTYVTNYDELNIGQTYVTDDNKTRLYIELTEGRLAPVLGFAINGTATVSWGDNTTSTVTGSSTSTIVYTQHTYSIPGIYTIAISSNDSIYISGDSYYSTILSSIEATNNDNAPYRNSLTKVELGNNVILGNRAFYYCSSLETVTLPNSITNLGTYCFAYCESIKNIVFPNNMRNVSQGCFYNCTALKKAIFSDSITEIKTQAFYYCYALEDITLPGACTILRNKCFGYCYNIKKIKLLSNLVCLESGVFYCCKSLEEAKLYPTVYRCTFASEVFSSCTALKKVDLGQGFGALDSSDFSYCSLLRHISLPEGVTTIPNSCFESASSLTYIKFPSTITTVKPYSFRYCYGMGVYDFTSVESVPTMNNSNAFTGIPADCLIVVPDDLYEEWIEATGWVNLDSYIINESNWHIL